MVFVPDFRSFIVPKFEFVNVILSAYFVVSFNVAAINFE